MIITMLYPIAATDDAYILIFFFFFCYESIFKSRKVINFICSFGYSKDCGWFEVDIGVVELML